VRSRLVFALLVLFALLPLGTACNSSPPAPLSGPLAQALTMVPATATEFGFTDWALIKAYLGASDLTGQSSVEERRQFMSAYSLGPAPAANYVGSAYVQHVELWGWESADLVWEASGMVAESPIWILRFRDDFDFASLLARFAERGFSESEYRGVTIYSHEKSYKLDWIINDSILNTAVLTEDKLLILSRELDNVHDVLAAYQGEITALGEERNVQATAGQLGEVAAVIIVPSSSTNVCPSVSIGILQRLPPEIASRASEAVQGITLHRFNTLGVGYRYEQGRPLGLIVMHYTNAGDARSDLEPRRKLAAEGPSLARRTAFYSDYFTVEEATVEGTDLVLKLRPAQDKPKHLFTMLANRDMLFAACP